jgi:hypothetical protein
VRLRSRVRFLAIVCSARKIPRPTTSTKTDMWVGGPRGLPNKNIILLFLKFVLCFLETISTGGFITPTASENRFPLAVLLSRPLVKIDFYWRFSVTRL